MNREQVLKKQKRAKKIFFSVIVLFIGIFIFLIMSQESKDSLTPELHFQSEQLKTRCHQIDDSCFYFEAFDKELFCLLKTFKKQHPELQIEGVFRSGNGTFVTFSLQKREKKKELISSN